MAKKDLPTISDVIKPSETVPATTSRPIVVTNRPILSSDPMMKENVDPPEVAEPAEEPSVEHLVPSLIPPVETQPDASETPSEPAVVSEDETANVDQEKTSETEGKPNEPGDENAPSEEKKLAAETARQAELEKLVVDGTYNIPINAAQRKRSRTLFAAIAVLAGALVLGLLYLTQR